VQAIKPTAQPVMLLTFLKFIKDFFCPDGHQEHAKIGFQR